MKNKRNVLYSLAIMLVGVIYLPVQAQQKNGTHRANFSGEWKLNEAQSDLGKFLCAYDDSDRMGARIMKIATEADFLTVEVVSSFRGGVPVARREKLTFDGKESKVTHSGWEGKKYTVKWSDDGQTMTVNSVVFSLRPNKHSFNVTEVWKLINNGKSISIQVNRELTSGMKLVYDKAG